MDKDISSQALTNGKSSHGRWRLYRYGSRVQGAAYVR
jgi:hypothetical protein